MNNASLPISLPEMQRRLSACADCIGLHEHQSDDDLFRTGTRRTGYGKRRIQRTDGRTTIFDYWSIDSIRRWNNHGRYNEHLLNAKEKGLRHFYRHVLNLCNSEAAIARGCFFDLMYANLNGWQMMSTNNMLSCVNMTVK